MKEMAAGVFKGQCLAIMDQILESGEPVLITKHGRPVAKLVPAEKPADDIFGYMAGKVKIVYRSLETATRDPQTFQTQQVAALAAGRQNHLWDYLEAFYRQQGTEGTGYVTNRYLTGLADEIPGLDISSWRSARNDSALINRVQSEQAAAVAAGVQGTPTLIFQGPRGKAQSPQSVPSYHELEQAIKSVA